MDTAADSALAVRRVLDELDDAIELLDAEIIVGELPRIPLPQQLLEPHTTPPGSLACTRATSAAPASASHSAREILRRHSGDIWLERPSTFCFRVP
jgi:hypothetical protein